MTTSIRYCSARLRWNTASQALASKHFDQIVPDTEEPQKVKSQISLLHTSVAPYLSQIAGLHVLPRIFKSRMASSLESVRQTRLSF